MNNERKTPNSVGIIMDGNRRWAKNKGLPGLEGHHAGGDNLKKIVGYVREAGIKHVIFYTFSTENWNRGEEEVSYLINLIAKFLENELEYFNKEGGVLHFAGDLSKFSPVLQEKMNEAKEKTKNNSGPHIYFALNYGGRAEILSAVKQILKENPNPEDITEEYFGKHLQTYPMPDPEIIIRTSGELRLSGFLPWQGVYSELFFTDTLWPDFSKEEFFSILSAYEKRDRRIGK
jgi:undecaprenyl diphosphate synthase